MFLSDLSRKPYRIYIVALFFALAFSFAIFGNGLKGDFVYDDKTVITANPLLEGTPNWGKILFSPYHPDEPEHGLYRPLTSLTFGIQYYFSDAPIGFHILNIILHAFVSWLIFVIAKKYLQTPAAFMAMLLFVFLPIHVEAVTSIVGRGETLSLLFSLLAIYFAISGKNIVSSLLLLLGLLSKETAIATLGVILIIHFLPSKSYKNSLQKIAWHIISVFGYFILRFYVLGKYAFHDEGTNPIYNPLVNAEIIPSTITALKVLWLYIVKTFVPITLSPDYSMSQIPVSTDALSFFQASLGILILTGAILAVIKTSSYLTRLGILLFLGSYLLVSNLFIKIGTIMGERLFYTPSAGLVLALAALIQYLFIKMKNKIIFYGIFIIILSIYGWVIISYNQAWLNRTDFFTHGYKASPNSFIMRANYAQEEFLAGRRKEATKMMEDLIIHTPNSALFISVTGEFQATLGNIARAEELWLKAIEIEPKAMKPYFNLGTLYYQQKKYNSTELILTRSVEISPLWLHIVYLGLAKIKLGKPKEAIALVEKHYGFNPNNQSLILVLGFANLSLGNDSKARQYLELVTDPQVRALISL